jgi:hypothetical protein
MMNYIDHLNKNYLRRSVGANDFSLPGMPTQAPVQWILGFFPRVKLLGLRLRTSGTVPPLPVYTFIMSTWKTFYLAVATEWYKNIYSRLVH